MTENTIQNWLDDPSSVDEAYAAAVSNIAPLKIRAIRDKLLKESDWVVTKETEQPGSVTNYEEWKTYRQALRDLPATASPKIDVNENLLNVTWPTKPE